jgi:hypothetical protein
MKKNLEKIFYEAIPTFGKLLKSPVGDVGWAVTAVDSDGLALGGGIHQNSETAMRITIAECLERATVMRLMRGKSTSEFLLDQYPGTCGFACGFESEAVRFRALCEAYERWIWEQWIDSSYNLEEIPPEDINLSPLALSLSKPFDNIRYFKRSFTGRDPEDNPMYLNIGIVIGYLDGGVFPGSRVTGAGDDLWTHGTIEAWRHTRINELESQVRKKNDITYQRIFHFAKNAEIADKQINHGRTDSVKAPKIKFLKEWKSSIDDDSPYFVWRALCEGFVGWEKGDINRFIY